MGNIKPDELYTFYAIIVIKTLFHGVSVAIELHHYLLTVRYHELFEIQWITEKPSFNIDFSTQLCSTVFGLQVQKHFYKILPNSF